MYVYVVALDWVGSLVSEQQQTKQPKYPPPNGQPVTSQSPTASRSIQPTMHVVVRNAGMVLELVLALALALSPSPSR